MQKWIIWCVAILLMGVSPVLADAPKDKILIMVSNMVDMGDAEKHDARNNLWEVAPPYHIFKMHDYEVDFVSPKGGKVEFSMNPVGISSYAIKYEGFLEKVAHTLRPSDVKVDDYAAVFIGGGYGPMFDIANNGAMLTLMAEVYEAGGVIGGCGHGPGSFANVKLSDGTYMVAGRKIAGFPDATEVTKSWAKKGTLLPFLVESQLRKNGAIAQNKQTLADKTAVVIDSRIVSTMFLPSSTFVAQEMVHLLKEILDK